MSDCTQCGLAPSSCRCKLVRRYITRDCRGSATLPLDLPPAKVCMRELETAWRTSERVVCQRRAPLLVEAA